MFTKKLFLKITLFICLFFILCSGVAFILREDNSAYARVLLHELYEQDRIDILYCGASHVSHGIDPDLADELTGKKNFCAGTASQTINGTYAILRQAVKLYDIEQVFIELDFAQATDPDKYHRTGFTADYLVAQYIKDPQIRLSHLLSISTPEYYLNSLLPIGKNKHMTLRPKSLIRKIQAMLNGNYFAYKLDTDKHKFYAGRGCMMNQEMVKNGSFNDDVVAGPIAISNISEEWTHTLEKMITLCQAHDIKLTFYAMPCSDFYLNQKGNYDEFYTFCKDFTTKHGYDFYDFNLAKETYLPLEDLDFSDDNHFSKQGIYKWTNAFWDYFLSNRTKQDMFYDTYAQKMQSQADRIFGVLLFPSDDKKTLTIQPVCNHVAVSRISYDVTAECDAEMIPVVEHATTSVVQLPTGKSGTLRVVSYLDGIKATECTTHFTAF